MAGMMIGLRSGQAVRGSEFRYRAPAALCLCLKAAAAGACRRSGSAPVPTLIRAPDGIRGIPDRAVVLAGAEITLTDEILDRIDAIVPPGTDVGTLDMAYNPPAIQQSRLRRRLPGERSAA
jgi:hypothetical protein